jgi:hypothetical protein
MAVILSRYKLFRIHHRSRPHRQPPGTALPSWAEAMGSTLLPSPVHWLLGACLTAYVGLCSGFRDRNPGSDAYPG